MAKAERNLDRLPKWARDEITYLRRDLADREAELAIGPEDSDTFTEPYTREPTPLGRGTTVKFVWPGQEGRYPQHVTARLDDKGRLQVSGSDQITIEPVASNLVYIHQRDR